MGKFTNWCRKRKDLTLFEIMEFEKEIEPCEPGTWRVIFENEADTYKEESDYLEGIYVSKFVKYNNEPYAIDSRFTYKMNGERHGHHVYRMLFSHETTSGYKIELVNENEAAAIRDDGEHVSERDALKLIGKYLYPENCICLDGNFTKETMQTVRFVGYEGTCGDVYIYKCTKCKRHWLHYHWTHEAFTASSKWYMGLIDKDKVKTFTPDMTVRYLESIGWYWHWKDSLTEPHRMIKGSGEIILMGKPLYGVREI